MIPHPSPPTTFRRLHQPGNPFILLNVWDIGSARMAQALGAQAIATSSAALAHTLGKADGTLSRDHSLAHAADLVRAVTLPVSADLENGYGDTLDQVADTFTQAARIGLSGASIEDTALPGLSPYPTDIARARVAAAARAAAKINPDFILTARADGVMNGTYDAKEAAHRLTAYALAGAHCLYAPMLSFADAATLCQTAPLPVNILIAGDNIPRPRQDFAAIGAARLSLGGSLARATHRLIHDATRAILERGDFTLLNPTIDAATLTPLILGQKTTPSPPKTTKI